MKTGVGIDKDEVNLDVWSMGMSMKVCAAVLFF